MAQKLAPGQGKPGKSQPDHPAVALLHALSGLHGACLNARLFDDLAERRRRAREADMNFRKVLAQQANHGPDSQRREAAHELMRRTDEPFPSNEPPQYTNALRDLLDNGRMWCAHATKALGAGGAKGLDAELPPNAAGQRRSIELHTKLQDADEVFGRLWVGVGDPSFIIDKDAASMAALGKWFRRTRAELRAVIETRGLNAPLAPPTVPAELLERLQAGIAAVAALTKAHASHMDRVERAVSAAGGGRDDDAPPTAATMGDLCSDPIISTDTFGRIQEAAGIKPKLKGAAARNRRYTPKEVDRLIAAALSGNFIKRRVIAEKWAKWGSKKAASKPHGSK